MSALPIPVIRSIARVFVKNSEDYNTFVSVFVCPDPMAGRHGMFTVVALSHGTGRMKVLGRELPRKLAYKIAEKYEP